MLVLYPKRKAPPGPTNGMFAVVKGVDKLRLILNGQRGNYEWDQAMFQTIYEEIIATDPMRAEALGLSARLMLIPNPATLVQLPDGADEVGGSDFASYFYSLLQLKEMVGSQKLPDVDGAAIGLSAGTYTPCMRVMSMGNWLSACLAQLIHRHVMLRLTRSPVVLLQPNGQSNARRMAYQRLTVLADAEGTVRFD